MCPQPPTEKSLLITGAPKLSAPDDIHADAKDNDDGDGDDGVSNETNLVGVKYSLGDPGPGPT